MIPAGTIDKRVSFQAAVRVSDGMGGFTDTYATQTTVWGGVTPMSANELMRRGILDMVGVFKFTIRYMSGIKPSWRIKYDDRYFNIVSLINVAESDEQLDIIAKEVYQ